MSYAVPSAEVAADFRDALQDLKVNNRPEISNLTVIAKENTEHAQAISQELENHIRTTRPEWKLPALYVLDSIVKNVGTPYTVYLGRNLYRTFMDAYTLMDMPTRKAMEGLLKTWKQPVPESRDPRPVFSPDVTREIENALIKYRTVAIQHQQQQARSQRQVIGQMPMRVQQPVPWRNTPTPPQNGLLYPPTPSGQNLNTQYGSSIVTQDPRRPQQFPVQPPQVVPSPVPHPATPVVAAPNQQYSQVPGRYSTPVPAGSPPAQPSNAQVTAQLLSDVRQLIVAATIEVATNPSEARTRGLLNTLQSLQKIVETQQLGDSQLQAIRAEVSRISDVFNNLPKPVAIPTVPQQSTPLPPAVPALSFPQMTTPIPLPTAPAPLPVTAAPPLSDLLSRLMPTPNSVATPIPPLNHSAPPSPLPQPAQPAQPSLFDTLRAAGLLQTPSVPASNTGTSLAAAAQSSRPPLAELKNDVQLNAASLKIPRPHLIASLYEARPDQCRQCGRRFPATKEGKEMKQRHLDWHFTTNTRVAENANSVVYRSWYIDEMEWIKCREQDDAALPPAADDSPKSGAAAKKKEPKEQYIPVPTDPAQANATCPICQERFEVEWHKEAEQPVWMDAVKVGGRTYHASCYAEVSKGSTSTPVPGRGTPDSVLGKRKWELEHQERA